MMATAELATPPHKEENRPGDTERVKVAATEEAKIPTYTMQALWDGKLSLKDFEVAGNEKPNVPHNVFEQDEALPVIDVAALLGSDKAARDENLDRMLQAAKTWGFFKIRNHGIALEVVHTHSNASLHVVDLKHFMDCLNP